MKIDLDETRKVERLAHDFASNIVNDGLVLYGGANIPGPRASALLNLPLGAMPAMGQGVERDQPGVANVVQIEALAEQAACELFDGAWAEVRLQSCTLANLAVYASICEPGDTIAVTPRASGGHLSHQSRGAPGMMRLKTIDLPFDDRRQGPADAQAADLIRTTRPKLVMLGASLATHPFEFPGIRAAADEVGAIVGYDVAHIAGLIAGGAFPNPLLHGADFLTMSSYKSLGGPPGGIIIGGVSRFDLQEQVRSAVFPWMTANYDATRVAALTVSLHDSLLHGKAYARAMIENARALQNALEQAGITVAPSETHHLALPLADPVEAMQKLEACGILCGTIFMSGQSHPQGLRIGTQLLTRRGFGPADMGKVAHLLKRSLTDDDPENVRNEVRAFSHSRSDLVYCQAAD